MTDIPAPPPAPPNTTGGRIGAQVIDTLLFVPVFLAMARLFGEFGKQDDGSFQFNLSGWPFIFFLLVWLAYFTITEMVFGKSLGKRAVGLRVVAESGEPASTGQILIRNALRVIDILPFFYLVGFITTAVSSRHQRIGDLVAKTIVVAE